MTRPIDPTHTDSKDADEAGMPNPGDPGIQVPPPRTAEEENERGPEVPQVPIDHLPVET